MYDTIVIGAGIAGISAAYWLKQEGQKVLLIDKRGLLSGASGAAGAFLSPRLGRGGDLQLLTNEAYLFALNFYSEKTPEDFFQKGVVRVPKDEVDAKKFQEYKKHLKIAHELYGAKELPFLSKECTEHEAIAFLDAAFVDPIGVAKTLSEKITCRFGLDAKPTREADLWRIGEYRAENIVLATGSERLSVEAPYIEIGGVWGERVDLKSSAYIPMSVHKKISVSANIDGIVRVGATHVRGETESEIERVNSLLVEAIEMVPELKDQKLLRIYAGRRSSVSDHFPLVGPLPDAKKAYELFGVPSKKIKPGSEEIPKLRGCFIAGCYGGRGFVFAPLMGKLLAKQIVANESVTPLVSPDRYLLRHLRKRSKAL